LGVPEVRELRQIREENARLKRLVADLTLDKQIPQDVLRRKAEASSSTGAGAVDSRPLPSESPTRVCAGRHLSQHLVLPIAGA
jgi:putative transposase